MFKAVTIADLQVCIKEIERRLGSLGIRVQYAKDIPTAYCTENTIVLPSLPYPITDEELRYHRYKALHETGHHMRREIWAFAKKIGPMPETFRYIWNLVEDEALEAMIASRYRGDRATLETGRAIHVHRMNKDAAERRRYGAGMDEDAVKSVGAYVTALLSRGWHKDVDVLAEALLKAVGSPEAEALHKELMDEGWSERIAKAGDVPSTYDLARELHMRLYPDEETPRSAEEVQQNPAEESQGNQGDEPSEGGKAQQKQEGEGDEQGEAAEQDDKEGGEPTKGKMVISWDELLNSDHDEMLSPEGGEVEITFETWSPSDGAAFFPETQIRVEHPEDWGATVDIDMSIANQLRRHVQAQSRSTWETERSTGRINKRALKRIVMGTEDRHRRVFQRRTDTKAIDTAISVLVDCSGSMGMRRRAELANTAAATLVECFGRVLRVPIEVLGHTCSGGPVIYEVKRFTDQSDGRQVYSKLRGVNRLGNADGDALLFAAKRLAARKESRKILILIADGQPTESYCMGGRGAADVLHTAIAQCKAMGIETHGIGIGFQHLNHWFKDCEYIPDDADVTAPLLRAAEKFVTSNKGAR